MFFQVYVCSDSSESLQSAKIEFQEIENSKKNNCLYLGKKVVCFFGNDRENIVCFLGNNRKKVAFS